MERDLLNNSFLDLLMGIVELTHIREPGVNRYNVSVHQVRLLSYPTVASDNAPEGMHQDGTDYIVSALVMNRYNVQDDESIIYNSNKTEIYRKSLGEGEFIFQEDRQLWHDITPIRATRGFIGYRDILGFDVKLVD